MLVLKIQVVFLVSFQLYHILKGCISNMLGTFPILSGIYIFSVISYQLSIVIINCFIASGVQQGFMFSSSLLFLNIFSVVKYRVLSILKPLVLPFKYDLAFENTLWFRQTGLQIRALAWVLDQVDCYLLMQLTGKLFITSLGVLSFPKWRK